MRNRIDAEYHDPEDGPFDDEPFDINEVGSVGDGDWPPMVTARAFQLLPQDLQARFGKREAMVFNGDILEISVDR